MQNTIDKILHLTLMGTGSSSHQMVLHTVKKFLKNAGIPFLLKEESDVSTFLEKSISSVPCIEVEGEYLPIESNGDFNKSLRKALKSILRKYNYGNMDKVIIPVDFSDVSNNAFVFGHRMATDIEAVVKALHVYLPTSKELYESTVVDVDFVEMRKNLLNDFVNEFDRDWASDIMKISMIDKEFRTGFPGEEILDSVEDNAAELVVMGTTGDSGILKKWFGSVSTKIMNEASCPVLLVPEKAAYKGIRNIMYAYDDIQLDREILDKLVAFCKKFKAKLHLVHVDTHENTNPGFYLQELLKEKYPKNDISVNSLFNVDITEALDEYAEVNSIDVVSLGTKNRSFFARLFHQSITKKMSLHSAIPLLILKQ